MLKLVGAPVQFLLLETQGFGSTVVPEHGPSVAVNVEQESIDPLKEAQFYGGTQPKPPPQTQLGDPSVFGGYQAAQSASFFAVVFIIHVFSIQFSIN